MLVWESGIVLLCHSYAQFLLLKYLLTCISITYGFLKSKKKKLNINEQNYLCLGELYMFMTIWW